MPIILMFITAMMVTIIIIDDVDNDDMTRLIFMMKMNMF